MRAPAKQPACRVETTLLVVFAMDLSLAALSVMPAPRPKADVKLGMTMIPPIAPISHPNSIPPKQAIKAY